MLQDVSARLSCNVKPEHEGVPLRSVFRLSRFVLRSHQYGVSMMVSALRKIVVPTLSFRASAPLITPWSRDRPDCKTNRFLLIGLALDKFE